MSYTLLTTDNHVNGGSKCVFSRDEICHNKLFILQIYDVCENNIALQHL